MTPNELRHRVAAIREEFRRMKFDAYQRAALMQVFELLDQQDALVRAADEMAAKTQWLLNKAETLSGWEWDDLKHSDDVSNALFHYRKMRDRQ